jgi:tetrahydromethanopterin S-methyltransferase subunit D
MMEPAREMGAKDMGVEATPPVAPEEARVPATRDADALVSALIAVVGAGLVVAGSLLRWISLHNQALPLAGRSPLDITAAGTALTEGRVAAGAGAAGLVAAVVMFASLRPAVRRILGGVALAALSWLVMMRVAVPRIAVLQSRVEVSAPPRQSEIVVA